MTETALNDLIVYLNRQAAAYAAKAGDDSVSIVRDRQRWRDWLRSYRLRRIADDLSNAKEYIGDLDYGN